MRIPHSSHPSMPMMRHLMDGTEECGTTYIDDGLWSGLGLLPQASQVSFYCKQPGGERDGKDVV